MFAICVYCNKSVFIPFYKCDRTDIIEVKQSGKYGMKLYAHKECYMAQTIGAKKEVG